MFSSLVGFLSSFSLPFSGFLFCFYFAASSSRSLSLPPSPLSSCSFLTFPSSALFSLLSSAFLFLPLSLILLFVPVVVSSSCSSDPSFSPSFSVFSSLSTPLAFPFLPPLSSHPLFSLPLSSPFLSLSPLPPFMLAILPSRLSSLPLW